MEREDAADGAPGGESSEQARAGAASSSAPSLKQVSSSTRLSGLDQCWGSLISGCTDCGPAHAGGRDHLQTRFCHKCRDQGICIPVNRVRVLPRELYGKVQNSASGSVWMRHRSRMLPLCRVINQTFQCTGERLVVFRTPLTEQLVDRADQQGRSESFRDGSSEACYTAATWLPAHWPQVPREIIWDDRTLHLAVSKGTLVPLNPPRTLHVASAVSSSSMVPHGDGQTMDSQQSPSVAKGMLPTDDLQSHESPCGTPAFSLVDMRKDSAEIDAELGVALEDQMPLASSTPRNTCSIHSQLVVDPFFVEGDAGAPEHKRARFSDGTWSNQHDANVEPTGNGGRGEISAAAISNVLRLCLELESELKELVRPANVAQVAGGMPSSLPSMSDTPTACSADTTVPNAPSMSDTPTACSAHTTVPNAPAREDVVRSVLLRLHHTLAETCAELRAVSPPAESRAAWQGE
eukprot:scaffold62920_cov37-Tisochrysis_lutea.AAC.1